MVGSGRKPSSQAQAVAGSPCLLSGRLEPAFVPHFLFVVNCASRLLGQWHEERQQMSLISRK